MKKYVLYQHAGSGNHGCEALVRTVIDRIRTADAEASEFILLSGNVQEDEKYSLKNVPDLKIVKINRDLPRFGKNWFGVQLGKLLKNKKLEMKAKYYTEWLECDAVYIAVGGDNYCYAKGKAVYDIDRYIKGKKILFGCSVEPDDLDGQLTEHLKQFSRITARETITYEALKKCGIENVTLVPDTAFTLKAAKNELDEDFVGINISPMIMKYSDSKIIFENYRHLVEYIIENTKSKIMFVPHVTTKGNDDREAIKALLESLGLSSDRYITAEDADCTVLKGYISKCSFFIGARTHATIAAYSTGVPTLTVGYSVKSKGIARDIFGTYEGYVVPVETMKTGYELRDTYVALLAKKDEMLGKQAEYTEKAVSEIKKVYPELLRAL